MSSLRVKVLGCGSSLGVPVIACDCLVCSSNVPYNNRTRSSIMISNGRTNVLVDCGVDLRNQCLREKITRIDAVILTHDHSDHIGGIDDLRVFAFKDNKSLDFYTDKGTMDNFSYRYQYLMKFAVLEYKIVNFYDSINIDGIDISLFEQDHGSMKSIGIKIKDFVYANDVVSFPKKTIEKYLYNNRIFMVDCRDFNDSQGHSGLATVLKWHEEFKPQMTYLTNMSHSIDYFEIQKVLPKNVIPTYDGEVFEL